MRKILTASIIYVISSNAIFVCPAAAQSEPTKAQTIDFIIDEISQMSYEYHHTPYKYRFTNDGCSLLTDIGGVTETLPIKDVVFSVGTYFIQSKSIYEYSILPACKMGNSCARQKNHSSSKLQAVNKGQSIVSNDKSRIDSVLKAFKHLQGLCTGRGSLF